MAPEIQERNPYVGPRPFERQDRDLFFGRDREASEVLSLVIAHRVLLLYAQSGAGKTSLLNAKLIPLLEGEEFEVLPIARVRGLIPGDIQAEEIPNLYVFNTLMSWAEEEADPRQLAQMSIAAFLKQRVRPLYEEGLPSPRAIVFDQFEELFAFYQERWQDRERFFEQVRDALEGDPLLRVIFVMREDYIAQLDPYAPLLPEKLRTRFRLERLREGAALSAVTGPLRDTERSFAEDVAEQLVEELLKVRVQAATGETVVATGEFVEPVQLQVVCQSLWRDLPPEITVITRDHLQAFGDVNQALSGFYETCVERAVRKTSVEVGDLLSWFEHTLITPAGTRGTVYRGREETGGIPNAAVDVLESLHLIRGEWRAGARWYELTHDRFIEPIQESKLTWLQMIATVKETTASLMEKVAGGFDRDVYLQRQDVLNLFKEFMDSKTRCFVLTGKSGSGKSNFVLSLQDEYKAELDLCLLAIDASQIDTYKGLSAFISDEFRRHWGLRPADMPDVWETIDGLPDMDHRTVLLVLDAVNENMQPHELLRQINEMLLQPWKWLKVLITSRPEVWQHMCFGQRLAEELFFQPPIDAGSAQADERPYLSAYEMKPFSQDELPTIYARYREKFGLETPYDALLPEVRQLIQEPLQLWMVASTYEGEAVPEALPAGELVEGYINTLTNTNRLDSEDVRLLRDELIPLMAPEIGQYTNVITVAALAKTKSKWLKSVFSEGYYSTGEHVNEPFQRLVDAQIVVKRGQGRASEIQFQHERFYDHFFGQFLFEQRIKPAPDKTEVCQRLIDAIEDYPFLWGAVKYALYLTLDDIPDVIKQLAFTDSLNVSYLISAVLGDYAQSDSQAVRDVIRQVVSLSTAKRSKVSLNQRLQATEAALRVAGTLGDKETFVRVLLGKEATSRDVGVKHAYYLSKREPHQALETLQMVSEEITKPAVTLNFPALQSTFRLTPLLALDCYQEGELDTPIVDGLIATLRDTVHRATNKALFRMLGDAGRTWMTRAAVQILLELLRRSEATSTANLYELNRFFSQPDTVRRKAREALVYLDRTCSSLSDVSDLIIELWQPVDRISEVIAEDILVAHGVHRPSEAESILRRVLDEVEDPGNTQGSATFTWHMIASCQPAISAAVMETMRTMVSRWLDSSKPEYGLIKRLGREYPYYPLSYYGVVWTEAYPGIEIDLWKEYMDRAVAEGDQELLFHIIDTFSDLRYPLHDYRVPLRILSPYIREPDPIRDHLVRSLGALRGLYPLPVDHFLLESEAPSDLVNDIRSYSYQHPSIKLYAGFGDFLPRLLVYAPVEFVREIIEMLDEALQAPSFNRMAATLINQLLDTLTES